MAGWPVCGNCHGTWAPAATRAVPERAAGIRTDAGQRNLRAAPLQGRADPQSPRNGRGTRPVAPPGRPPERAARRGTDPLCRGATRRPPSAGTACRQPARQFAGLSGSTSGLCLAASGAAGRRVAGLAAGGRCMAGAASAFRAYLDTPGTAPVHARSALRHDGRAGLPASPHAPALCRPIPPRSDTGPALGRLFPQSGTTAEPELALWRAERTGPGAPGGVRAHRSRIRAVHLGRFQRRRVAAGGRIRARDVAG